MSGGRFIVTGATGFLGGALVRKLLAAGHEVVALGRQAEALLALARDGAQAIRCEFVKQVALPEPIVKQDLGRLLLKLEALQDETITQALAPKATAAVAMSDPDREAALALLRAPDLIDRIAGDLTAAGLVGERINKLVGYLAAVSRKLDRPLAVLVQSSSAAGKSSLMEAILATSSPE